MKQSIAIFSESCFLVKLVANFSNNPKRSTSRPNTCNTFKSCTFIFFTSSNQSMRVKRGKYFCREKGRGAPFFVRRENSILYIFRLSTGDCQFFYTFAKKIYKPWFNGLTRNSTKYKAKFAIPNRVRFIFVNLNIKLDFFLIVCYNIF